MGKIFFPSHIWLGEKNVRKTREKKSIEIGRKGKKSRRSGPPSEMVLREFLGGPARRKNESESEKTLDLWRKSLAIFSRMPGSPKNSMKFSGDRGKKKSACDPTEILGAPKAYQCGPGGNFRGTGSPPIPLESEETAEKRLKIFFPRKKKQISSLTGRALFSLSSLKSTVEKEKLHKISTLTTQQFYSLCNFFNLFFFNNSKRTLSNIPGKTIVDGFALEFGLEKFIFFPVPRKFPCNFWGTRRQTSVSSDSFGI